MRSPAATSTIMPGATWRAGSVARPPVGLEHRDRLRVERQQPRRRPARAAPRAPVEVAPDQQEEQQHDRAVEIGVLAAARGLEQAHRQASTSPTVIGTSMLVRPRRSACQAEREERPAGIDDRRQRDQRREPVQQRTRRLAHALGVAGPDRDRQQHHVAGGEARDRHGAQQLPLGRVLAGGELRRVVGNRAEAEVRKGPQQATGQLLGPAPGHREPPRGQVDARALDRRVGREGALDAAHAAAAMHAVDHQMQPMQPALGLHIPVDDGDSLARRIGDPERVRGHGRRNTRRVPRQTSPAASMLRSTSHWPASGSSTSAS